MRARLDRHARREKARHQLARDRRRRLRNADLRPFIDEINATARRLALAHAYVWPYEPFTTEDR